MAKLTKAIVGVRNGKVYPESFEAGADCPAELEDAARVLGALGEKPSKAAKDSNDRA